ncbi:CotO family spore coat protein [Oceanobacillus massiliensis]|uniref:CotO family spore coat protein n=1 Tax=Oceanobacillus massiliensis TaxID=1465765 RepID=UPI00301A4867
MVKKKFANDPLLYIHQPDIGTAQAPMQHHYMSNKKKDNVEKTAEEAVAPQKAKRRQSSFQNSFKGNAPTAIKSDSVKEPENKKNFKEMNVRERINYFLDRPEYAPKVRCEIKANGRTYRGVVLGMEDKNVIIKASNRKTPVQVLLDDINEVQLLGF